MDNLTTTTESAAMAAVTIASSAQDVEQPPLDLLEYGTSIASLVLLSFGLLGNGLCMRIMITTPMRPYSASIFLFFVTAFDSVVLIFEAVDDLATQLTSWDRDQLLFGHNEWRCRFGAYFYEVSKVVSGWLVVAMAAELTLVAGEPRRAKVVYTRGRSFYVALAVCLIAVAGCFPFLVIVSASTDVGCNSKYEVFNEIYSKVILHVFVNCLMPLALISVCSARSLYYLAIRQETARTSNHDNKPLPEPCQLPKAVLTVSLMYVLAVSPRTAVDLAFFVQRLVPDAVIGAEHWKVAAAVSQCIYLLNFSAKFYLVVLLEQKLRAGFAYFSRCGMIRTSKKSRAHLYMDNNVNSIRGVRDSIF